MLTAILAQAAPPPASTLGSVWDLMVKGGPVMIPIAGASLVAIAVIIERSVSLRRSRVIPPGFVTGIQAVMAGAASADRQRLGLEFCKNNPSPIGAVFAAALRRMREPLDVLERHIEEEGQREALKLRKYLRVLSVISSVATLLGLLGTIFGMITAFQTVAASGEALGKTELLARGIYEALITTAAGLIVSIPAVLGYHYFAARVEALVAEIDRVTCDFVEEYVRTPAGRVASSPSAAASAVAPASASGADAQAPAARVGPESAPAARAEMLPTA
jgi:biopolymer transport protein ExbB